MCHSYGQTTVRDTGEIVVEETSDIVNVKTDKHVNIPGTRIYFMPKFDFKPATSYTGYEKTKGQGIQVMDLIGGNYYTNTATFTKEAFEKKGIRVIEFKEIKVNNFAAKYVELLPDKTHGAFEIVFGDSTFSTMVTAIYDATDFNTRSEIRQELYTIYYDKNMKVDPFATAAFTLDESTSIFKFASFSAGTFVYSIGGAKDTLGDQPFITVTTVPKDTFSAKGLSKECVLSLTKYGLTTKYVQNSPDNTINGMPAYETEISGVMKDKVSLIYQLVVLGKEKAVILQGLIPKDFAKNEKEIKKFARTIKMK